MNRPADLNERGLVSVELAMSALWLSSLLVCCILAAHAMFGWAACQLTANEVAREHARGDSAAVAKLIATAPPRARVEVRTTGGASVVEVHWVALIGPISLPLLATATVLGER